MDQQDQAFDNVQARDLETAALIQKIGGGDQSALTALFDGTSRLLFGLILRILKDRTSAEEVLLDTYTHVWKQSASYDPKRFTPLAWLITIARDRAIARLLWDKQEGRKPEIHADTQAEMTVSPELQQLARSAIESLVSAQREVLEWAFYSGLSCSEIAAQIGKPLGAVKTHARLGLTKLSDTYRPLFERKL